MIHLFYFYRKPILRLLAHKRGKRRGRDRSFRLCFLEKERDKETKMEGEKEGGGRYSHRKRVDSLRFNVCICV